MNDIRKYQLILSGILLVFFYVLATEIAGRWMEVYRLYCEFDKKQQAILTPQAALEKRKALTEKKNSLTSSLIVDAGAFDQSQTGVFEFLNSCAKQTGVRFESLVPLASQSTGQLRDIGFKIDFISRYNQLGLFLNAVETRALKVQMKSLDMISESSSSPTLTVSVEGVAHIILTK